MTALSDAYPFALEHSSLQGHAKDACVSRRLCDISHMLTHFLPPSRLLRTKRRRESID